MAEVIAPVQHFDPIGISVKENEIIANDENIWIIIRLAADIHSVYLINAIKQHIYLSFFRARIGA
jgi:hypothetical protein